MTIDQLIAAGKTDAEILAIGQQPRPRDIDVVALRKIGLRTDVLDAIEQAAPTSADARRAARLFAASGVDVIGVGDPEWQVAAETIAALIAADIITGDNVTTFQNAAFDPAPDWTLEQIASARAAIERDAAIRRHQEWLAEAQAAAAAVVDADPHGATAQQISAAFAARLAEVMS